MDGLEVTHSAHDETDHAFKVVAHGEIDVATVAVLAAQFDELRERDAMLIVLDASGVGFVDSSGLRCIIAASHEIEGRGGRFLIEGMSPAVQGVLQATGLLEKYRSGE
ncbi:MAG TPA: STAS domain-containing protein [Microthrixaceae bacterium]|nr:STAS domain-containing protein [Microthrixaceae bacterium]